MRYPRRHVTHTHQHMLIVRGCAVAASRCQSLADVGTNATPNQKTMGNQGPSAVVEVVLKASTFPCFSFESEHVHAPYSHVTLRRKPSSTEAPKKKKNSSRKERDSAHTWNAVMSKVSNVVTHALMVVNRICAVQQRTTHVERCAVMAQRAPVRIDKRRALECLLFTTVTLPQGELFWPCLNFSIWAHQLTPRGADPAA